MWRKEKAGAPAATSGHVAAVQSTVTVFGTFSLKHFEKAGKHDPTLSARAVTAKRQKIRIELCEKRGSGVNGSTDYLPCHVVRSIAGLVTRVCCGSYKE